MRTGGWLLACALLSAHAAVAGDLKLVRGKYLVEGVLACANCHAVRDRNGAVIAEKGKAIREGIRPDGSLIGPPMPIHFYRNLSDADLAATVKYLRAQPAVSNMVPKSTYNFPLPPNYGPPLKKVAAPPMKDRVAYGGYLVAIAHCMECHTPRDEKGMLVMASLGAGGQNIKGPWGDSISRNLTPHAEGLRDWSDDEIASAIRTGKDRSGQPYKPPMAFNWYHNISDPDVLAIVAYLRTLPPRAGTN